MPNQKLLRKLQIKPGYRLLLLNPPAGFATRLEPLPEGTELHLRPEGSFNYVHLFAQNSAELVQYAQMAIKALQPDGIF